MMSKGVSAKFMRQFFIAVTIPRMMYVADLFLVPGSRISKGTKGFIGKLAKVQRQASLHITGAMRSAPMDMVDACTDLVPFHLLVKSLTYRATTRMVTLPWSHPLVKHIDRFPFYSNPIQNKSPARRTLYLVVSVMQSFKATCWLPKTKHKQY